MVRLQYCLGLFVLHKKTFCGFFQLNFYCLFIFLFLFIKFKSEVTGHMAVFHSPLHRYPAKMQGMPDIELLYTEVQEQCQNPQITPQQCRDLDALFLPVTWCFSCGWLGSDRSAVIVWFKAKEFTSSPSSVSIPTPVPHSSKPSSSQTGTSYLKLTLYT